MPLNKEQQRLVEENLGLVGQVIKDKVHGVNSLGIFTYDDVFQIGCVGLSKAAMEYKPGRAKFSTYAYISIRNEIYDALDYATLRRNHEIITSDGVVSNPDPTHGGFPEDVPELDRMLELAKARASNVVVKGIDAIRLMADGYTAREIGEMMGGVPANNVTAWISKARAFLKHDPAILALRESA